MANDLNKLNNILFQTLEDVQSGKMEEKKAQTIVNIGNSIVNNAKIQLAAYKATRGKTAIPLLSENKDPELRVVPGMKRPEVEQEVAAQNGYKNVAEAVIGMGKDKFKKAVDLLIKDENAA